MITILGIMDKLYSDTKALTIVYFVGTGLLLLFIVMLAFSLRKKDTPKKEKISDEEEKLDNKNISLFDNNQEESKDEKSNVNDTIVENNNVDINNNESTNDTPFEELNSVEEVKDEEKKDSTDMSSEALIEATQKLNITPMNFNNNISQNNEEVVLQNEEVSEKTNNEPIEETKVEENVTINTDIPDVDSFVDQVVNKTVEKNEQFSSIYVGDETSTTKLDTVLDKLNVDDEIKDEITPISEKASVEETNSASDIIDEKPVVSSLDDLKKTLDSKKSELSSKEEDLKNKLNNLKNTMDLPKINPNDNK